MKKSILIIFLFGLIVACSGEKKESDEAPQITEGQVEVIEESTQKIDVMIDSSSQRIDTLQNEIDELLKDI